MAKARVKLAPPWPSLCHEERSGGKRANGESGGSSAATVQAQGAGALLALQVQWWWWWCRASKLHKQHKQKQEKVLLSFFSDLR